jgi:DNA repair exonuclease SbcCD ATPase subunit
MEETTLRMDTLKSEIEMYKNRTKALEGEIAELNQLRLLDRQKTEQSLKAKQDEIASLTREIENLQVKLSANSGSSGTVNMYKELVEKSESRIAALNNEVQTLRSRLSQEQIGFSEEKGLLSNRLRQAENLASDLASRLESVNQTFENAFGPDTENSDSLDCLIQKKANKLSDDLHGLKNTVEELRAENERLTDDLNRKVSESADRKEKDPQEQIHSVPNNGTDDVVSIIQSQRDRFRSRVLELESERDQLKQAQFDLNNRINVLIADCRKIENEKNFWRAQSVEHKLKSPAEIELGSVSSGGPPSLASVVKRRQGNSSGDMEQTLTSILVWGLGNPVTRRAALLYLVTLHMLVFFVLYRLSSILSTTK